MPGSRKTSVAVSIAFPFSGTGLLMLAAVGGFSAILRFCEHVLGEDAIALSSAMVVVFALMGASYVARCLLVTAESSADGYDAAPAPPSPIEVEEFLGAFLGLLAMSFFAFGPLLLVLVLGLHVPGLLYVAVGLGAVYLPMGVLGQAVRGDLAGTLPVRILPAILAAFPRYLPSVLLAAGAGFLALAARDGALDRLPMPAIWAVDVVAGWLLFAAVHRAGVVHREEAVVRAILPVPDPAVTHEESAIPHRPLSDIERALLEREKETSSQ